MKMFSDTMSGARDERPGLAALMEYVREGDTVVAWKLDRLGRNTLHIPDTVKALTDRGVTPHQPHDGHSTCSSSHCDRAPSSSVSPTPSPAGVSDGSRSPEVRVVRGGSLEFSSLRTPLVRLRVKTDRVAIRAARHLCAVSETPTFADQDAGQKRRRYQGAVAVILRKVRPSLAVSLMDGKGERVDKVLDFRWCARGGTRYFRTATSSSP